MNKKVSIKELSEFLLEFAITMLQAGANTERAVRNTVRIASAYGYEVHIAVFQKNISMTITDKEKDITETYVRSQKLPKLNLNTVSELSALSWDTLDNKMSLESVRECYKKVLETKPLPWVVMWFFISMVTASFCKLFGGDIYSMVIVFISTLIAFAFRELLLKKQVDARVLFVAISFTASFLSLLFTKVINSATPDVAISTSILFLTPGVLIINSVTDILDGHIITGFARGVYVFILLICIAVGLYITLMIKQAGLI